MKTISVAGKTALITGASRGIGKQISTGLARRGCNLILHSRDLAGTAELAEELRQHGVNVDQVAAELKDQAQVDRLIQEVISKHGGVDILYNNAAVMTPYRNDWLNFPAQDFRDSFEVNVISLVRLCFGFIPAMKERGWGRIVNVTSGVANTPEMTAYAASKAAVDKFVLDTAAQLAPHGVLMNLLDPGWLRTDLGGEHAPNPVEAVMPGALVPALNAEGEFGKLFRALDYTGLNLE